MLRSVIVRPPFSDEELARSPAKRNLLGSGIRRFAPEILCPARELHYHKPDLLAMSRTNHAIPATIVIAADDQLHRNRAQEPARPQSLWSSGYLRCLNSVPSNQHSRWHCGQCLRSDREQVHRHPLFRCQYTERDHMMSVRERRGCKSCGG